LSGERMKVRGSGWMYQNPYPALCLSKEEATRLP